MRTLSLRTSSGDSPSYSSLPGGGGPAPATGSALALEMLARSATHCRSCLSAYIRGGGEMGREGRDAVSEREEDIMVEEPSQADADRRQCVAQPLIRAS